MKSTRALSSRWVRVALMAAALVDPLPICGQDVSFRFVDAAEPRSVLDLATVGSLPLVGPRDLELVGVVGRVSPIGSIRDATFMATSSDPAVLVLDGFAPSLTAYRLDGEPLWSMNREGDGPEDLLRPLSVAARRDSVLIGSASGLVRIFDAPNAVLPKYDRSYRTQGMVYSACAGRDFHALQALSIDGNLVEVRSPTGAVRFAAIEAVPVSNTRLLRSVAEAEIECLSDGRLLVAPRSGLDEVRIYRPDGTLDLSFRISGLRGATISATEGGFSSDFPEGGLILINSAVEVEPGRVVLQFGRRDIEDIQNEMIQDLTSVLIDTFTGQALGRLGWDHPVIDAQNGCILERMNQLIPEIRVRCAVDGA